MSQAQYYFVPDVRQGLAAWIKNHDPRRASIRVELDTTVRSIDPQGESAVTLEQTVQLYGPGDILGFDGRIVARTDPKPDVGDFEPSYFPAIEFADPDFAWRFTPASTDKEAPKLTPWIVLIVLETGVEFEEGKQTDRNLPRFIKQVSPTALPDLVYAWRWAHVQVTADEGLSEDSLKNPSAEILEQAICRLMCPRRLKTGTRYTAFVVPTFKLGALAGRGLGFESVIQANEFAWQQEDTPIDLPYYYRWEFGTGERGDFEHLVRLLEPRALSGLGIRDMDCARPGFGTCGVERAGLEAPENHFLGLEGALQSVDTQLTPWGRDAQPPEPLQEDLAKLINQPEDEASPPPIPTVLPPIYGRWHAARKRVSADDQSAWIDTLNLDPRHRAAAGLGAEVVRKQQEALMASAWEQLGMIETANDILRRAQLGRASSAGIHKRLGQLASDDLILWVTSPVQKRVLVQVDHPETGPRKITVAHCLRTASRIPMAALDPAFRRIIRPRGPIRKRQGAGLSKDLLSRLAEGGLEAAGPSPKPAGTDVARLLGPRIEVASLGLDFGTVEIGKSLERSTEIRNAGKSDLTIINVTRVEGTSHEFSTTGTFPLVIAAGRSETLRVSYTPWNLGPDTGALVIESNDPDTPGVQLDLIGSGGPPPSPKICIDPETRLLNFGPVPRETLARSYANIHNCGAAELVVSDIALAAASSLQFAWTVSAARIPFTILAGRSETVTLTCQPTFLGNYSGTLTITSNDPLENRADIGLTVEVVEEVVPHDGPVATDPGKGLTALGHGTRTPPSNVKQAFVKAIRETVLPALDPERTVVERVGKRVGLSSQFAQRLKGKAGRDPLDEILAAPSFPQPMYEPLRDMAHNLLLPGVERVPQNTIGILQANRRFLESYMCGLNHEFAGELLWRGYPTDQRGSYFRQFWDISEYVARQKELDALLKAWLRERNINSLDELDRAEKERQILRLASGDVGDLSVLSDQELNDRLVEVIQQSCLEEKLRDVKLLTQWNGNALGHNKCRTGNELVLVIRGDLLRRFPDALIYAIKAVKRCEESVPGLPEFVGPDEQQERIFPVFGAALPPDLTFLGFPFAADVARGNEQDPGVYFVLEERVGRTRFGLDDGVPELFETWDDLSWSHFGLQEAVGKYLDSGTITNQPPLNDSRVWNDNDGSGMPQSSSATRAWITFQKPARVAVHARQMLSEPTIRNIQPRSGQQDSTLIATITGQALVGATDVRFSGSGVTAQVLPGSTSTELKLEVNVAWWAPIGPRNFTVNTPLGVAQSPETDAFAVTLAPSIITRVQALNDTTVKIVLEKPAFQFPERLADAGPYALISPESLLGSPESIAVHPVGTGPYVFTRWRPGEDITLSRNIEYCGTQASIPEIRFQFLSSDALGRKLEAEDIDMCDTQDRELATMAAEMGWNVFLLDTFYMDQNVFLIYRPEIIGNFISPTGVHLEFARSSHGSNVLRYGCLAEPTTFDPLLMQDSTSLKIASQMLEGLTGYRPGQTTVDRVLARGWDMSMDGKEWIFYLRRDVIFHDGRPFDAHAVVVNFKRHMACPSVERIMPESGMQGTEASSAVISGLHLDGATAVVFSGTGVTSEVLPGGTEVNLPLTIVIAVDAPPGDRTFQITTPRGVGDSADFGVVFTVTQASVKPTITDLSPRTAMQGSRFTVTISGKGLAGATQVRFSGEGVTAGKPWGTDVELQAEVTIEWWAQSGMRSFTVVTPAGTARSPDDLAFSVTLHAPLIITEAAALDDYTVKVLLNRSEFSFVERLTNLGPYAQVSPLMLQKPAGEIAAHPVGTGPFVFQEWVPGSHVLLARNDTYWRQKPSFEQLIFRFVGETAVLLTELLSGDIDICDIADEKTAGEAAKAGLNVTRVGNFYGSQGVFVISRPEITGNVLSPRGIHLEFAESSEGSRTLRYGCLAEPTTFDPLLMQDSASLKIASQVLESLMGYRPGQANMVPTLARSADTSPDAKEWYFNLCQEILFHDGSPFTADAVVANLTRQPARPVARRGHNRTTSRESLS